MKAGNRLVFSFLLIVLLSATALSQTNPAPLLNPPLSAPSQGKVVESYGKLPLGFEANQGQTDAKVKFLSRGSGYTLFLTGGGEAVLSLRGSKSGENATPAADLTTPGFKGARSTNQATTKSVLRIKLRHANHAAKVLGEDELPGRSNYFIGDDPKKWRSNVASYTRIRYRDVYPGIDLVYYGNQGQLEYDWVVSPGADPRVIAFKIDGAQKVELDAQGDLVLRAEVGDVRIHKPLVYQEQNSEVKGQISQGRQILDGRYRLTAHHQVRFGVQGYDKSKLLIIDPVLVYSTYLGGIGSDSGSSIAVDAEGNAYVTGSTDSTDFPTANAFQAANSGGGDAFVAKLNAAGSALVYSTYLGGTGWDSGNSIAVDLAGNAYVTGQTQSTDFPTAHPLQATNAGGGCDAFVMKLNAAGSALIYSTYLGGIGSDSGSSIAVDAEGNAYVTGSTDSTDFPTANAFQAANSGGGDAFVTKLNAAGSALVYSTYMGGTGWDSGNSIAMDLAGNAYLTGRTESSDFPTAHPLQATSAGGGPDVFVMKLNAAGSALVYSTYLGGTGYDVGYGIAVDSAGNAYVTGVTDSTDFPTANPFQAARGDFTAVFVTKLNAAGSALVYSTYLGGSGADGGSSVVVDSAGNAYVTGNTWSGDFPTTNPFQGRCGGAWDAFVTELNTVGSALVYSSCLGGNGGWYGQGDDGGNSIAVDSAGNAYITGYTRSEDFPIANPFQGSFRGQAWPFLSDGFVTKVSSPPLGPDLTISMKHSGDFGLGQTGATYRITASNFGSHPSTGTVSVTDTLPAGLTATAMIGDGWTCAVATLTCTRGDAVNAGASYPAITLTVDVASDAPWNVINTVAVSGGGDTDPHNNTATDPTTIVGPPTADWAYPAGATGTNMQFILSYSAPNGRDYTDLSWVEVLFNTSLTGLNGCYVIYKHYSLYLENQDGTGWLGPLGPGEGRSLSNNQCTVNGAETIVLLSGRTIELSLSLSAASGFIGVKNTYMWVRNSEGMDSGWQTKGTWTPAADTPPTADSVMPAAATGNSVTFALAYSAHNGKGYADLGRAEVLFNTSLTGMNGCYVIYYQPTNRLYLENGAGTGWLGPLTPGSAGTLSNNQCTVNGGGTTVSRSGQKLTLNLSLSAASGFIGVKNTYMWVADIDSTGPGSGWQTMGTWTPAADTPPTADSVTPAAAAGSNVTFALAYSSHNGKGYTDLGWEEVLFNTSLTGLNGCYVIYYQPTNRLYLENEDGTVWLGPLTPGSGGTLSNDQCTVNGAGTTVSGSEQTLMLNLSLSAAAGFTGTKNTYMWVDDIDSTSLGNGWQTNGTWTPQ